MTFSKMLLFVRDLKNRSIKAMPLIYLQASILFNIGSIWSQIGAKQVRKKLNDMFI